MKTMKTLKKYVYGSLGDTLFLWTIVALSITIIACTIVMAFTLYGDGAPAFREFGFLGFLKSNIWDPGSRIQFGAAPFIVGTLVTSIVSLLISFIPALSIAIFTTEYAPRWLQSLIDNFVNLIAAIPSVIIGLWGIFVFVPWMRENVYMPVYMWSVESAPQLLAILGNPIGYGMTTATIILALMILPYTTVLAAHAMMKVPKEQREAAYALGATKWEVIRMAVIPYARAGILAGSMLSFGRAIGETMAVAMLIGNKNTLPFTIFGAGSTMPSVIVNEFREAVENMHLSSLMAVGFQLFIISLAVNLLAAYIQNKFSVTGGQSA